MFENLLSVKDKTALITGASSGLGKHFAKTLSAAGAHVIVAARRTDRLDTLVETIRENNSEALAVTMDVTDPESVDQALSRAYSAYQRIDILINNAGIATSEQFHEASIEDYDFVMNPNLKGAWYVAKSVAAHMVANNYPGSIINIASILGLRVSMNTGLYAISKAGMVQMTKVMAIELARKGIRVNALCPGFIQTALNGEFFQTEEGKRYMHSMPAQRLGKLEELDAPLLMLASDAGSFITGTAIPVDGGHSIKAI